MEHISLNGYIRNTPSDTEVHAERQLRVDRSTWPVGKNVWTHSKLSRLQELGGNRRVSRTGPALGGWGNWSRGLMTTLGQQSESEEKHLRLRVKELICGRLNGRRIRQSLLQPYIPQMAQRLGAGVQGVWSNPRARAFVDCEGMWQIEGVWERRLWWEMPVEQSQAATEARGYCWVVCSGWSHHHSLSPLRCRHWQLNNREVGPSNKDTVNLRAGPLPGCPLKCLTCWSTE